MCWLGFSWCKQIRVLDAEMDGVVKGDELVM
jgi:hypothetical protein